MAYVSTPINYGETLTCIDWTLVFVLWMIIIQPARLPHGLNCMPILIDSSSVANRIIIQTYPPDHSLPTKGCQKQPFIAHRCAFIFVILVDQMFDVSLWEELILELLSRQLHSRGLFVQKQLIRLCLTGWDYPGPTLHWPDTHKGETKQFIE